LDESKKLESWVRVTIGGRVEFVNVFVSEADWDLGRAVGGVGGHGVEIFEIDILN
jgi:hypothetical protein